MRIVVQIRFSSFPYEMMQQPIFLVICNSISSFSWNLKSPTHSRPVAEKNCPKEAGQEAEMSAFDENPFAVRVFPVGKRSYD